MPAPSPPILAPRPPTPSLPTPPPQQPHATGNLILITLYGLDLWSLLTSWGSRIQALLEAQPSPSLSLQGLSAPGMCASQLLALNTTALLNTSLTAGELMPGLGYFAMDVAQLLREYVNDSSIAVQVPDFCAGNRTVAPFIDNRTLVNGPWPTLRVTVNLLTTERLSPSTAPLRQLLLSCRGALTARDSLGFFTRYGMPFHRCQTSLLPNPPPTLTLAPPALSPSLTITPSAPPVSAHQVMCSTQVETEVAEETGGMYMMTLQTASAGLPARAMLDYTALTGYKCHAEYRHQQHEPYLLAPLSNSPTPSHSLTMKKRMSKAHSAQLNALNNSPRAGNRHCPNNIKAAASKAQATNRDLQAEVQRLRDVEQSLMGTVDGLQGDLDDLQAAHQRLQGEHTALQQVACRAAATNHSLRAARHRLQGQVHIYRNKHRPHRSPLTFKQRQQLLVLEQHPVSMEVLRRCAEAGYGRLNSHGRPMGSMAEQLSPAGLAPSPSPTDIFIPTQEGPVGRPAARTAPYNAHHCLSTVRLHLETGVSRRALSKCRQFFVSEQCVLPNPHRPGKTSTVGREFHIVSTYMRRKTLGTTPELAVPAGAPPQQQQQLAAASTSRKREAPAANKPRAAKQGATHSSVAKRARAARLAWGEIA
ncbi:hypothetical protein QJQ45_010942 [Haematococcus lacustris]|nr:hypothetical protein QJQ45_010942 [Haematococcus lacustris]